jgi:MFS transporter, MHS family, citrate/tricarballylate:H+ symporter
VDHGAPDPAGGDMNGYWKLAVLALMLLTSGTIGTYVLGYLTTYAQDTLGMSASGAFGATVSQGLVGMLMVIVGGYLSDRFGRKPTMLWPTILGLAVTWPAFWVIGRFPTPGVLFGMTALLAAIGSISAASMLVAITESLPKRIRAGSLALIYALAISVFGGSTQFVIKWLIEVTHNPLAPAFYMTAATAIGLTAILFLGEIAPGKSRRA